jgi:ABC-type transport system involved in Fe-S cluster assembly fused permease/ATPase subunit
MGITINIVSGVYYIKENCMKSIQGIVLWWNRIEAFFHALSVLRYLGFVYMYMYIFMSLLFHSPELKAIEKEVEVVLKLPDAEALSPPILQINEVSFGYSPDKMIFSNVNLGATLESRICIVSFF